MLGLHLLAGVAVGVIMTTMVMAQSTFAGIRLCCPNDHVLVHDNALVPHQFECRAVDGTAISTDTQPAPLFGYNLLAGQRPQLPLCSGTTMERVVIDGTIALDGLADQCIGRLDNTVVALKCAVEPDYTPIPVDVNLVAKCCADGSAYDLRDRACAETKRIDAMAAFRSVVVDSQTTAIVFMDVRTPMCSDEDEVFVEYLSAQGAQFARNSVTVWSEQEKANVTIPAGTFCVDAALEDRTKVQLIVRTCRPRSICGRIPCVRRCCRTEQMMVRQNETTQCVPYRRNIKPMFYDLGSSPTPMDDETGTKFAPTAVDVPGKFWRANVLMAIRSEHKKTNKQIRVNYVVNRFL